MWSRVCVSNSHAAALLACVVACVVLASGKAPCQEPAGQQIQVRAEPQSFGRVGDQAQIAVALTDDRGKPVVLEQVTLIPPPGLARPVTATTDDRGIATFTVQHTDQQIRSYAYKVRALGQTKTITLPVGAITVEMNPVTGKPYAGIVADGVSNLGIGITLPTTQGTAVRVNKPALGSLKMQGKELPVTGEIRLDASGQAQITYHPPAYLQDAQLTEPLPLAAGANAGATTWGAVVPLDFTVTDASGKTNTFPIEIRVYRPPVILVHGFLGATDTWAKLASHLRNHRFDARLGEFYAGDESLEAQSLKLAQDTGELTMEYASHGAKLSKLDVVGHSMGGLIARHYVKGSGGYQGDVRKLIMVGTPNHGVGWMRKKVGAWYAGWEGKHQRAAAQLYERSPFIARLNQGEAIGAHLDVNVQYGNIYGFADDWVVSAASADLNGVASKLLSGVSHSAALPGAMGTPITEHAGAHSQILEWLTSDIYRPPLVGSSARVVAGAGEVIIRTWHKEGKTDTPLAPGSEPVELKPWQTVITGTGGKAKIWLTVNDKPWGKIDLDASTELGVDYVSPRLVEIQMKRGRAVFVTNTNEWGGHFSVALTPQQGDLFTPSSFRAYRLAPRAVARGLETQFAVSAGETIEVFSLEGSVAVETADLAGNPVSSLLDSGEGLAIQPGGITTALVMAPTAWWEDPFYQAAAEGIGTAPPPAEVPDTGKPAVALSPDSVVKQAVVCERIGEESVPEGVRERFPAGTEKVGLFLEIEDAPPNTELSFRWYHGDTLLRRQIIIISGDKKTITYIYAADQEHLWPGRYAIEIVEKGNLIARLIFTVG